MWLDWLVFCEYRLCVCLLMPLATPTVLLGFLLTLDMGTSSRLLQQSAATAPYLGQGVSPHSHPSWPWMWSSSSWPSCPCAAIAPGKNTGVGCISFSRGSSPPRNQTWVSCIAGRFFTNWGTRNAHLYTVPVGYETEDQSLFSALTMKKR